MLAILQVKFYIDNQRLSMGKKIENYVLETVVGEGEFGKVYKALNEKTGQLVAVKIIKIEKFKMSPKLQEFTINEIQTLSKIEDTTHVVRFIEILKTANNYYFVYEFCNGGTLQQEIKQHGRFEESKAIDYFKDLLKAFQILTKSNIMHRDIKPSNILLHNGVIKLADFGFCKPLKDSRDLSQTMLGSPIYMAPEILKGEVYTMKADIWSLGVVLYEMLYGFCPFQEKTIVRLISLIDETSVVFPSNVKISKRTEELLRKMLVKDHFKRIGWEQLFNYELTEPREEAKPIPLNVTGTNNNNPFSKKNTFTSIITEQVRNRYLTPIEGYRTVSNNTNANISAYQTRKKQQFKSNLSVGEKRILQNCVQVRSKCSKGLTLLKNLLHQNSSKLTVSICCFLAKKVLSLSRQNGENLKKVSIDKENRDKNGQIKRLISILADQRIKIQERLLPMESQADQVKQPLDILFLKFAQEEGLTQERDGLLSLVQVYDYLHNEKSVDYSRYSKKQLLQQYEKRIYRKA